MKNEQELISQQITWNYYYKTILNLVMYIL